MEKKENISIIKEHLTRIFEVESKKYQSIPKVFVFDKEQFLKHRNFFTRFNNKYKLVRDNAILERITGTLEKIDFINSHYFEKTAGFTNGKNITLLLKEYDLSYDLYYSLYFIIETFFHEFKHIEQREQRKNKHILKSYITDFDTFRNLIERSCAVETTFSYKLLYNDFFSEIEANVYGSKKAHEYCSSNNLHSYGVNRSFDRLKMLSYDFDKFLTIYNRFVYLDPMYRAENKLSSNSTYSIFFDKVGKFKSLSKITSNPLFNGLDDRLKSEMLTSRYFLSSVNYELDDVEKKYISELVNKRIKELIQIYFEGRKYFSRFKITDDYYLSNQLNLLSRIEYLVDFNISIAGIKYDKKESLEKLLSKINSVDDYFEYELYDESVFHSFQSYFNDDIRKNIFILDYLLRNNFNSSNYVEIISAVTLLKDTMKRAIGSIDTPMDAEYETIIDDCKHIRK